jgi:hypothetical protein
VPGSILPDAALLVPLLAVGAQALQTQVARLLVELAAHERGSCRRDRFELVARALDHTRMEAQPRHHPLRPAFQPQAFPVAVVRNVVVVLGLGENRAPIELKRRLRPQEATERSAASLLHNPCSLSKDGAAVRRGRSGPTRRSASVQLTRPNRVCYFSVRTFGEET